MKNLLFSTALIVLFSFTCVLGQSNNNLKTDSLVQLLNASKTGNKERIQLLGKISNSFINTNPAESIKYGEEGLKLAATEHDTIRASFMYTLAIAYGRTGNFIRQFELSKQAMEIYKVTNNQRQLTRVMSALAMAYYNLGNFESSLKVQLEVLKIREKQNDFKGLVGTFNNLGIVYQRLNQIDDAIESYNKALEYITHEKLDFLKGPVLNNLGSLYTGKKEFRMALACLDEAFKLHSQSSNYEGLINTHINYGVLYTAIDEIGKATENYEKAHEISKMIGDRHGIAVSALNLSVSYREAGDYRQAAKYADISLDISVPERFRDIEMDGYQSMANLNYESGNFKEAFNFYKKYSNLKDSLFSEEANENMSKMRALYEADKKEQMNILLSRQLEVKQLQLDRRQRTIYFVVIIMVGFLILLASVYKLYLQNKKSLKKELELNRLISRFVSTVSHEFRTPLSGISSSVQLLRDYGTELPVEEQKKLFQRIGDSITGLKSMLDDVNIIDKGQSGRLGNKASKFSFDDYCNEIISNSLVSEPAGNKVKVCYEGKVGVICTDRELVGHVITNIISNAVKYTGQNGEVCVYPRIVNGNLKISVTDNGRGIPEEDLPYVYNDFYRGSNVEAIPGTGLGMSIVKTALNTLGGAISLSSKVGEGTSVEVSIPCEVVTESATVTNIL